ncbi:MAG: hypothetical protein KDC03_19545 [Flavobacteriales bacterium]|nr:hypothetical protein [Flavobacteriales bacterium]HRW89982.1 hypothetical protein [Flavobacteriales bacterium]
MLSSASQWFMNIQEALRRSDQGADLQAFAEELEAINVTRLGFEVELILPKGLLGAELDVQWLAIDGRHASFSVVRPVVG